MVLCVPRHILLYPVKYWLPHCGSAMEEMVERHLDTCVSVELGRRL